MIKIRLHKLLEAKESLQKLSVIELPLKTSYKLAKMIKKINEELSFFEDERLKLCKKYGKFDEATTTYMVEDANMFEFKKEFTELLNIEAEFDCERILLPDTIVIKPIDLIALDDLIKIEE